MANLKLAQAKHRLDLKVSEKIAGNTTSSDDLKAMVERDTYTVGTPLNDLYNLLVSAEAERDSAYVIRKAAEHEVYRR